MLVFHNGILTYGSNASTRLDMYGNPVAIQCSEDAVKCYINTTSENRNGRNDDGLYKSATYSALIDMDSVGENFNPKTISLIHERKGDLGKFPVQRIEYYTITRSIEIWV